MLETDQESAAVYRFVIQETVDRGTEDERTVRDTRYAIGCGLVDAIDSVNSNGNVKFFFAERLGDLVACCGQIPLFVFRMRVLRDDPKLNREYWVAAPDEIDGEKLMRELTESLQAGASLLAKFPVSCVGKLFAQSIP
ncbi:hypothetical protein [Thalassoglobus neptunius]|uniref:hypothetical protein n=1 Tax=Thalassoglobus neptunius TaxID=1938619 RepID=UPI0011B84F1B|nr:hypothetical protein [Thalassoglobus neptunius]